MATCRPRLRGAVLGSLLARSPLCLSDNIAAGTGGIVEYLKDEGVAAQDFATPLASIEAVA